MKGSYSGWKQVSKHLQAVIQINLKKKKEITDNYNFQRQYRCIFLFFS